MKTNNIKILKYLLLITVTVLISCSAQNKNKVEGKFLLTGEIEEGKVKNLFTISQLEDDVYQVIVENTITPKNGEKKVYSEIYTGRFSSDTRKMVFEKNKMHLQFIIFSEDFKSFKLENFIAKRI